MHHDIGPSRHLAQVFSWFVVLGLAACSTSEPRRSLGVLTFAVAGDHVFVGRSITYGRDGTFEVSSMTEPGLTCRGRFRYASLPDGRATFRCSNGETGRVKIHSEGALVGSGEGSSSLGPVSLLFGYSAGRASARLPLPAGTRLAVIDDSVALVEDREADPDSDDSARAAEDQP